MEVKIVYCKVCNLYQRAAGLAAEIEKELGLSAELIPGDAWVFDIIVDGNPIFSRHANNEKIPQTDEIVARLKTMMNE